MNHRITLGRLTDELLRDATHVAVIPFEAGELLEPGARIDVVNGRAVNAKRGGVGVVDPFLREPVRVNERFWVLVNPATVLALRHAWAHPDFPPEATDQRADDPDLLESLEYMRAEAEHFNVSFKRLVEMARTGEIVSQGTTYGADEYGCGGEKSALFWFHLERATGERFDEAHRARAFFSSEC